MARRSGNVLPPPVDDYCISNSASAAKPIGKNTSNNTISNGRSSPPNGSSGRSIALPPAASWAMRASCQSQSASSICSNGSIKSKPDNAGVTSAFSPVLESRTQASMLHNNVEKESTQDEVSKNYNCKDKPDLVKPVRQITGADSQASLPDKHSIDDATTTVNLNDQSFFPPSSKDIDSGSNAVPNVSNTIFQGRHSRFPEEKSSSIDPKVQNLDFSSSRFDTVRGELTCISRTISSRSDQLMIKSPSSEMTLQPYLEQCSESMASPVVEKSVAARSMLCSSGENFDWETNSQTQGITVSKVQNDIMSFDNQTFEDSESVGYSSSLPHSANLLHLPNHSRSHSLQRNEPFSGVSLNSDPLYGDNRVSSHMLRHAPGNSVKSNGYYENSASNFPGVDRSTNHAIWHSNEGQGKHMKTDYCSNGTLDVGESSIISNILSLDLDSWDDSLASPQNLVKLLGDNDKQHSTLKMSSSWKPQNNSQSRFSFARHGESSSQASDDPAFGVFGQLQKTSSFSHDFGDNRNSYFDKPALGNGFSSSLQEPEIYSPNTSAFLSNRSSVPRAQISAPPGFSVPNRAPPPGFSSHERMDQTFDNLAGNHLPDSSFLLRNSFQPQPSGNVSTTDIEFMDPAILAVGKGRLQAGLNNPVIDMRSQSHFPQQFSALENEARFQLLMQRSLSAQQNLRYTDVGDRFSSISDSYGLSSRLVDQSPVSNLNSFSQLSLQQQSRNGLVSNGQWDGWNEVQGGNNLGMADLIRNERLGFNKFYASGYEDSKFRMPTSSDLYNRTFEM